MTDVGLADPRPASLLRSLTPEEHHPHALHRQDSAWSNTNCYTDAWIELLSAIGLDPVPALACALSTDFIGDQWEFVKPHPADLDALYGVRVGEYDVWRPLLDHLVAQTEAGNVVFVDVDGFHLPDTDGLTYRREHAKTSIVPCSIDVDGRSMTYIHNAGVYRLAGEDFEATVGPAAADGAVARPYVELVRLDAAHPPGSAVDPDHALRVLRAHAGRTPDFDGMRRLADYVRSQEGALRSGGMDFFHAFSFATTRQAGTSAILASAALSWHVLRLAERDPVTAAALDAAAAEFDLAADAARLLQFQLARIAVGRSASMDAAAEQLAERWASALRLTRSALRA